ncbi:MAG: M15 family metallopeptidase [Eubacteriales bacterium]|nr:M15 family metallopeptidase [Eubacteriales bacterium]
MPYKRPRLGLIIFVTVICIALVVATVFGVSSLLAAIAEKMPAEKGGMAQTGNTDTDAELSAESPGEPAAGTVYRYIDFTRADVHTGSLILVNAENEYVFPESPDLPTLYGNKSDTYKISGSELSLERETLRALNEMMHAFYDKYSIGDVLVSAGYRDYDTQMALYSGRVEAVGLEAVSGYVSLAGYSEHHTGLAFDLSVYTDSGVTMTLADRPQYDWLADNCHKYGFVLRYDPSKTDITGIYGEQWHFRRVGLPHSYYMKKHNLVLEEYIDLLRGYTFEGSHLTVSDDLGGSYEIYYIPLLNGDVTEIPVPESAVYTVSGNNKNGFIVTLQLS